MNARDIFVQSARVYLAEARNRRHQRYSNRFYWTLLDWAANARKKAASEPVQRGLFG